ncbi:invasin domain 3-containing protein, partial [Leucobacter manosquensis]
MATLVATVSVFTTTTFLPGTPAQAAGAAQQHGTEAGALYWPADADLQAGGVYSTAQVNNSEGKNPAWGPSTLSGLGAAIIGTKATPSEPITLTKLDGSYDRASLLGVSANANNKGLDGLWLQTDGGGNFVNAVSRPSASTNPDFISNFGNMNSAAVKWAPANDLGTGEKGKSYWVEIPWPTEVFGVNSVSCGIEVNPVTNELVIMNTCAPTPTTSYLVYSPGPDGDPLTLEDNAFRTFTAAGNMSYTGIAVTDMILDAAGNVYVVSGVSGRIGALHLYRVDQNTGRISLVSTGTAEKPLTYRAGAPVADTDIGAYQSGLAFEDGRAIVTSEQFANLGQYLPSIDPLAHSVQRVEGFPYGIQNSGPTKTQLRVDYDGAGTEGAIAFEGVVTDTAGNGLPGQTVAIYRDQEDGTAKLVGYQTTEADGSYKGLLNWSNGVGYARVVQPQMTTGDQVKNGEVVSIDASTEFNDGTNEISVLNTDSNFGVNEPLGTIGETTIDLASTADLVKISGNNAAVAYHADFVVEFGGSTADLSRNSLLNSNANNGNGPQHVTIEGDAANDLRIGEVNGSYLVGATDNSHSSDDGVFLKLNAEARLLNGQLLAQGKDYSLRVNSQGAQAENAKVSAWSTTPQASATASPRSAFGERMSASGSAAELQYTAGRANGFSTVRVDSSLAEILKPDNSDGEYAGILGNASSTPWVTSGEVEDHDVQTVNAIARVGVESSVPGDYSYTMSNVTTVAPSTTAVAVNVPAEGGFAAESGVHAVSTVSNDVVVTAGDSPAGALLSGARVVDSVTGDQITDAEFADGKITIPGSSVPLGADVRLVLEYSEAVNIEASSFELDPDTAAADGGSEVTANVSIIGAGSGLPLSGKTVTIAPQDANAPVDVSVVTDNGDGTYTARITREVKGTYTLEAFVQDGGRAVQVGGPLDAKFTAGVADASRSTWAISPETSQAVGATFTATATLTDAHGNSVGEGVAVSFAIPAGVNGASEATTVSAVSDADGVASVQLTSTIADSYEIAASVGGSQIGATKNIVFTAGGASIAEGDSSFTVSSGNRVADEKDAHVASALLRDEFQNPVAGEEVTFVLPAGVAYAGVESGAWVSGETGEIVIAADASGKAALKVVSTTAGSYEIAAEVRAGELPGSPASVSFVAGTVDASASEWSIAPESPLAAGKSFTATVIARDAFGNAVEGADIALSYPAAVNDGNEGLSATSSADGSASFTLTATLAGTYTVHATVAGNPVGGSRETGAKDIGFVAADADASSSELTVTEGIVPADSTSTHVASAQVRDTFGNAVGAGVDVVFALPAGINGQTSADEVSVETNEHGIAVLKMTATRAAVYQVSAYIGSNSEITGSPASVTFGNSDAVADQSSWKITPEASQVAGSIFTAEAAIADANGNPVAGETVTFTVPAGINGSSVPTMLSSVSNANGVATLELTSTIAGFYDISASVVGAQIGESKQIVFTAGTADASQSTIVASKSPINGDSGDASLITVQLMDQYGNMLDSGSDDVEIATNLGILTEVTAAGNGQYVASLTGTSADIGIATLTFVVNGEKGTKSTVVEIIDVTAPEAPTAVAEGDKVTGSAEPGAGVEIRDPETGETVCETVADENGNYPCGPVTDGDYVVVAVDQSGNESAETPVTVDTTAPDAPSVVVDKDTVTGETEPGAGVEIRDPETGETVCETVADE